MKNVKIIIEEHDDGFVAYPVGLQGVVIGQGDSYEDARADVRSALTFHLETFGPESLQDDLVKDAFLAETTV